MTTNLWTVGQGLITRRLIPKPVAPPKRSSRTPPRRRRRRTTARTGRRRREARRRRSPRPACGAAPGQAQEEANAAMSDERAWSRSRPRARRSARRSGSACASSSAATPASPASSVTFEVLSEGERGLLGVGTVAGPGRRLVRSRRLPPPAPPTRSRPDESDRAALVRELLDEIARRARGRLPDRGRGRGTRPIAASLSGPDVAVLIGKRGKTIDSIQYLVGAAVAVGGRRAATAGHGGRSRLSRPARGAARRARRSLGRAGRCGRARRFASSR